jgi:DNA mismatch repair protein MutS
LTQLADQLTALVNFNVAVRESGDDIVFLHRLEAGGADRSYGIQVGRLAGLPAEVVSRAREILHELEGAHTASGQGLGRSGAYSPSSEPATQFSLFQTPEPAVVDRLRKLAIDELTPLEALNLLAALRAEARGEREDA